MAKAEKKQMRAVVQDGSAFRVYTAEIFLGDPEYLEDEVQAPVRCKTAADRRSWFAGSHLAQQIGRQFIDWEFV